MAAAPQSVSPASSADPDIGALERKAGQVPACVGAFVWVPAYCCPCLPEQSPQLVHACQCKALDRSTFTALPDTAVHRHQLPHTSPPAIGVKKEKGLARLEDTALVLHLMPGKSLQHLVKSEWVVARKELSRQLSDMLA